MLNMDVQARFLSQTFAPSNPFKHWQLQLVDFFFWNNWNKRNTGQENLHKLSSELMC